MYTALISDFCNYSVIVFYDHDGTAAANILSILFRAQRKLKNFGVRSFSRFPN